MKHLLLASLLVSIATANHTVPSSASLPTHHITVSAGGPSSTLPVTSSQVMAYVDGYMARVVLDFLVLNNGTRPVQGDVSIGLPSGASPYFVAFGQSSPHFSVVSISPLDRVSILAARASLWNVSSVKEAVMARKAVAARAFADTVRRGADPALLETSLGGGFSFKVFPLVPGMTHRIVLAYDVEIPQGGAAYELHLPSPRGRLQFDAVLSRTPLRIEPPSISHNPYGLSSHTRLVTFSEKSVAVVPAVTFTFLMESAVLSTVHPVLGTHFAADCALPPLNISKRENVTLSRMVFVVDASLSARSRLFGESLRAVGALLEGLRSDVFFFNVVFFNIRLAWWRPNGTWVANTPETIDEFVRSAGSVQLEGASDLFRAVLGASNGGAGKWSVVVLSDGVATWGPGTLDNTVTQLKRTPSFARVYALEFTGIKANTAVLQALVMSTGGALLSVDETNIDMTLAINIMLSPPLKVISVVADGIEIMLGRGATYVWEGMRLSVVGRGASVPSSVVLTLLVDNSPLSITIPFDTHLDSPLALRAYGIAAYRALEALLPASENATQAVGLAYRVVGRSTSLLMLESVEEYTRYDINPVSDLRDAEIASFALNVTRYVSSIEESRAIALLDPKASLEEDLRFIARSAGVPMEVPPYVWALLAELPRHALESRTVEALPTTTLPESPSLSSQLSASGTASYDAWTNEAELRRAANDPLGALLAYSSLVDQTPTDLPLARDVATTTLEWGFAKDSFDLTRRVVRERPFEPIAIAALAVAAARMHTPDVGVFFFELVLAAKWPARFGDFTRVVSFQYAKHLLGMLRGGTQTYSLPSEFLRQRLESMRAISQVPNADLIVVLTWSTDNSDVDLHVVEPSGETCFYGNRRTKLGGELTQDVVQGFGPEMYVMRDGPVGRYDIEVTYFSSVRDQMAVNTKVYVEVVQDWGYDIESHEASGATLRDAKQRIPIVTVTRKNRPRVPVNSTKDSYWGTKFGVPGFVGKTFALINSDVPVTANSQMPSMSSAVGWGFTYLAVAAMIVLVFL